MPGYKHDGGYRIIKDKNYKGTCIILKPFRQAEVGDYVIFLEYFFFILTLGAYIKFYILEDHSKFVTNLVRIANGYLFFSMAFFFGNIYPIVFKQRYIASLKLIACLDNT